MERLETTKLASELVSLVDSLVDDLVRAGNDDDTIRPVAILRAEIATELLSGEVDRVALAAECLDLALLLASSRFAAGGDRRMQTILFATSLAGAA